MAQKYWRTLTHYPARNGQRLLGPCFLVHHPHMLPACHPYHSPWPRAPPSIRARRLCLDLRIRFSSGKYESTTSNSRSRGVLALKLGWGVGLAWPILTYTYGPGSAWVGSKRPESCHFVWSEEIRGGGRLFHSSLNRAGLNFQKLYVSIT